MDSLKKYEKTTFRNYPVFAQAWGKHVDKSETK